MDVARVNINNQVTVNGIVTIIWPTGLPDRTNRGAITQQRSKASHVRHVATVGIHNFFF